MSKEFNQIIQELEINSTNGKEYFCQVSDKKLTAIKELSKREYEESQQKNNAIDECIELVKKYQRKNEFLNLNEWQTRELLEKLQQAKGDNYGN